MEIKNNIFNGVKLIYCTSIAFSNKLGNLVQVHSMAKEFQKNLGENFWLGVNYKNQDDRELKIVCFNSNKSYLLAWRYFKHIKQNKIDHIYCREARLLFFIILYNKIFWRRKLKYAYEIHAILTRNFLDKLIDKILSVWVDKFIFITKNLQERYSKKYFLSTKKSIVSPDGVDLNIFNLDMTGREARQKLNLPLDKIIIGYTGKFKTMEMDKGIADILRALKIMADEKIIFIAVGGSEAEILFYKNLAAEIGVTDQAIFFPLTSQAELAVYQKAFDVLLMSFPFNQHYAYYMSPLKMSEYMASKRPIIASDLPSIREVLNENNSLIVRPDSPDGLAEGIKAIIADTKRAKRISNQAFIDVDNYTWEKRVRNILYFIK